MAAKAYVLNEDDLSTFKEMIAWWKASPENTQQRPRVEPSIVQAPETYLARIPAGGMLALVENLTGTGTGTSTESLDDEVGYAEGCPIYRLVGVGASAALEIVHLMKTVYNITTAFIPAGSLVLVTRDKFGYWFVLDAPCQCPLVTLTTEEVSCQSGILNIYGVTTTLTLVNGCLVKEVGDPVYLRSEGCCECDRHWYCMDPPDEVPGGLPCCGMGAVGEGDPPITPLYASFTNVSGAACFDGLVVQLDYEGVDLGGPQWRGTIPAGTCGSADDVTILYICRTDLYPAPSYATPSCMMYVMEFHPASPASAGFPQAGCTCSPFTVTYQDIVFSSSIFPSVSFFNSVTITVTEVAP